MGLEDAGDLVLHIVFSKIGPESTAIVACVSKRLQVSASEESLWSIFCSNDLNISTPLDPFGDPAPSFKIAYQLWRESFRRYPWNLVKRVGRCCDNLKQWLSLNFPEARATLRRGATEDDLQELETTLKVKLPLPTRLLYRFFDGQESSSSNALDGSLGLIGGYSVYSHEVNVYLLSLKDVIRETKETMRHLGFSSRLSLVVVAVSAASSLKIFFLDCNSGFLYVPTSTRELLPCVPEALVRSVHDINDDQQQDAMLLWLEEHVRRLQCGIIKIRKEENIKSISLFPEISPLCSVAITNGVQVRASSVFIPEISNLHGDRVPAYWYAYSIRMSLLPDGCYLNGTHHSSCQLYWRHWVIQADNEVISKVDGEAVIGKYPLLQAGEEEFVYESCSNFPTATGSIEGSFTFVPGSLRDQKGSEFEVNVAEFPLKLPDYIF